MNRKRYFEESKEKYPVGKLSPELRKALHLEDDMLPFWIYRMRVLGYPPAWMKVAEMSTLDVIDMSGSSQSKDKNPFAVAEEGEINETAQYNKDSLIEFPGFNAPIPQHVKDDWLILGMPPLIMKQQLSEAVKSMKLIEPVPYKKAKLDVSGIKDESPESPPSSPQASTSETSQPIVIIQNEDTETFDQNEKDVNNGKENGLSNNESRINTSADTSQFFEKNLSHNDSISSERKLTVISMGTPVPQSIKPKLPPLENWAIGMGDLLNFENLPTSTGAYKDKMKGIIDKVRNRFSKND